MSTCYFGSRCPGTRLCCLLGGWFFLILFLQSDCTTTLPRGSMAEPGFESANVYELGVLAPGTVTTRPVPIPRAELQQALQQLARHVQLSARTPREAARALLRLALSPQMWVVSEPTTKALAATLTVVLMGYLGLKTMYGLMDGWARMADTAHHATTFAELRAAGRGRTSARCWAKTRRGQ